MKKALWKDIGREIWRSKSRFISIFALILLGVSFFVGLKATGPDMIATTDRYYREYSLADNTVQSTYGLDDTDITSLEKTASIKAVEPVYSVDVLLKKSNQVLKVYSFDTKKKQQVNRYKLEKGRLPKANNEIDLDATEGIAKRYHIGDTVELINGKGKQPDDYLKKASYKVVGFVKTPAYIEKDERGQSTIGKGKTDAIAVISKSAFKSGPYTTAWLTFRNTAKEEAYTDGYDKAAKQNKKAIQTHPDKRLAKIKQAAKQKITANEKKLQQAENKLTQGEQKLVEAERQINSGKSEYSSQKANFDQKMANVSVQIKTNETKLIQTNQVIKASAAKITAGEKTIKRSQTELTNATKEMQTGKEQLNKQKQNLDQSDQTVTYLHKLAQFPIVRINLKLTTKDREQRDKNGLPQVIEISKQTSDNLNAFINEQDQKTQSAFKQLFTNQLSLAEKQSIIKHAQMKITQSKAAYQKANQTMKAKQRELTEANNEMKQKAQELQQAKAKLTTGKAQYQNGIRALQSAKKQLEQGKHSGQEKLQSAQAKLTAAIDSYQKSKTKFNREKPQAEQKIRDGKQQLITAKEKLATLKKPKYFVLDRSSNPGYSEYKENADRLTSLSTVFPVFFFLIAALVCLTTMTWMVEEQRTQIGTLKALGYSNFDIMKKFLVYGTLASVLGSIGGLILGFRLFPVIIFNAYGTMYNLPPVSIQYYFSYSFIALLVALVCTLLTAFASCRTELIANAAILMRPKAPKNGKRILLERLPMIWKKMNFTSKVTARNIFRYKQRMLMTVLGVAGCTALILTGFGLRDSISDIAKLQYGDILKYDASITKDVNATKMTKMNYQKLLDDKNVTSKLAMSLVNMETEASGQSNQTVTVSVPKNTQELASYIQLRDRKSAKHEKLTNRGAIVTEKLAKLYHLKPGDKLQLKDSHGELRRIYITAIAENYAGHSLYLTADYYQKFFHEKPSYNTDLLMLKNTSKKWQNDYAERLTKNKTVLNVLYANAVSALLTDTLDSLNVVMIVLVVSAALLAFIVLYNLTSINVSERIRELSTIKVLGFYPKEVTMYVYRENIILTLLGILVGFIFGFFLHRYVITTAEVDMMMFSPSINSLSYLYAAILTFVFATVVMLVMHIRLKRIDMIEALKSVE